MEDKGCSAKRTHLFYPVEQKGEHTVKTLIKDGIIITQDPQDQVWLKGWLLLEDDRISALGQGEVPAEVTADKTVNAKGLSFYRQPVSCAGAAPGPAVPSPTRRVRLPGSWYKSAVPPRDCHGPCGASPGASGGTKPPQRSSPLRRQLFRKIRCGQHRRLLQPRRRQRRQPCRHAGQTPSG